MPRRYNNHDDDYIREDTIRTRENERYFNPFKSIPLYRIYQTIILTASAVHATIQDAPKAIVGATAITASIIRYFSKKREQKPAIRSTNIRTPKSLEDSLGSS